MSTFAVIPAGGHSRRMGRPKLALPLGGRTVLEHVLAALRQAGVEDVVVVLAPHTADLLPLARAAGAHSYVMAEATPDMRATVEVGLDYLQALLSPRRDDDWLLVPADHPTLDAEVVRQLLVARRQRPEFSIVIPAHGGQRGHPALIGWQHVAGMRRLAAGLGLNAYLRQQAAETLELPVTSPGVLTDLDTPEDYERLRRDGEERSPVP